MGCRLPGSSLHGILQARILEWVAISFSRVSSQPRDRTLHLLHCRRRGGQLGRASIPKWENLGCYTAFTLILKHSEQWFWSQKSQGSFWPHLQEARLWAFPLIHPPSTASQSLTAVGVTGTENFPPRCPGVPRLPSGFQRVHGTSSPSYIPFF